MVWHCHSNQFHYIYPKKIINLVHLINWELPELSYHPTLHYSGSILEFTWSWENTSHDLCGPYSHNDGRSISIKANSPVGYASLLWSARSGCPSQLCPAPAQTRLVAVQEISQIARKSIFSLHCTSFLDRPFLLRIRAIHHNPGWGEEQNLVVDEFTQYGFYTPAIVKSI